MAEKNILAYFHSPEEAEGVAKKLQALRAIDVSVDRFGRYPGDGIDVINNPITGNISGLGSLTLSGDFDSQGASILAAADPGASGMSHGGQGGPTGRDILLTAVVDEQMYEKALQVVKEAGGLV